VKFEAPRGTHDILPSQQPLWRRATGEIERLCALYGYRPVQTPVFEDTGLFARTSGQGSDIVQKEMYSFEDRGGRPLTLRPEGTAPICRAYLEHGMHREPQPVKLYTIATMYRYAAPQRGRYREHWQASVEAIGSDDPAVDAEIVQLYDTLLGNLGVTEYTLQLNSIGDRNCRPQYVRELRAWLEQREGELDEDTRAKLRTSPLRALDNLEQKAPHVQEVLRDAPTIAAALCDECRAHFAAVRGALDTYGVRYELVPTLVRGLDYYTRTAWEFVGPEGTAQSTISGGGRYDYLVEEIGGPPTPGVGFGAGIERLLLAMEGAGTTAEAPRMDVFVVLDGADRPAALRLAGDLRRRGLAADLDYAGRSLKGQLTQASRSGARWTVLLDAAGRARVRERGAEDRVVELDRLADTLGP
jgi:histidyl-tRNA synthetase